MPKHTDRQDTTQQDSVTKAHSTQRNEAPAPRPEDASIEAPDSSELARNGQGSHASYAEDWKAASDGPESSDPEFEALRDLLLGHHRTELERLQQELFTQQALVRALEVQVNDKEGLIALVTPVLGDVIATTVRDSRDELVEALYPITGQLVTRAVSEAMADFVRRIDRQMRSTFSFGHFRRSVQARARGVSDAEIALREALPFDVLELFLIHRDSGLLLHQLSDTEDAELVSGMLTAVRDFVQDAFGRGAEGTLDELHYGDMQIFAEAGKYSYIAAVTRGYEPMGYRSRMRTQVLSLEHKYFKVLRQYDGDASRLVNVEAFLTPLTVAQDTSATQQAQHDHTETGDIEADRTESDNIESGDIESGDIEAVSGGKGVQGGGRKNQVDVATDGGKWSPIDGEHDHRRKEALPTRGAGVPTAAYGEEESVIAPLLPLIVVVGSVILLMVALWLLV